MILLKTIKEKLAQNDPDTVLRKMGYRNLGHARERLKRLLQAPSLESWLKQSTFDLHYSGKEFLRKLFEALSLPAEPLEAELARIDAKEIALAKMQQPYIFVDTNFKRQSQPIFALAMLESCRRLRIDKEEIYGKPIEKILKMVGDLVRRHYEESDGELPLWGKIHRYAYHHSDGRVFVFDMEGKLLPEAQKVEESRAQLSLHGKSLDFLGEEDETK
jgi:hypothetical protein